MAGRSLAPRIAALEADGSRFAVATVVAVQRPTSAKPGARGIIHPDGTIEGWVGGSCAQPVVVREALRCAGRRAATAAPAVEDGTGRGTPRGRHRRARHDLPFRRDPGDLRGAARSRPRAVARRHDPDRRRARGARRRRRLAGHRVRPRGRRVGVPRRRARPPRDRPRRVRAGERAVRRRRDPGDLGRGGAPGRVPTSGRRLCRARVVADAGAARPGVAARRGPGHGRAARRAPRAGGPRPRRRDAGGDRDLDPRRAGPGAARDGGVRRGAGTGDPRGSGGGRWQPSSRSWTISCSWTPSAG